MLSNITSNIPSPNNLLTLAQQEIDDSGAELAGAYRKATRALVKHFPSGQLLFTDFNIRTLRDWIVAMLCGNCSLQTVLYYLENVAALYNKAVKLGQAPKTDAFRQLKAELLETKGDSLSRTVKDSLSSLSRLAKGRAPLTGDMVYYGDLLLFSFYNRGLSIPEILGMTADDLADMPEEAVTIADKYREKRREKIFPRGAVNTVEQRTKMIAHHIGLDTPPDMTVGEITSRLWILAALRLGIPAGTIAQCNLPQSADLAVLEFAKTDSEPISDAEIRHITRQVADSITYNPEHWHVMKLRAHHSYEEVRDRLKTAKFKHIEYFYPQEEISRKIGKKLEFEHRPILPYVLFFRSKDTDIAPMFKHIGDIAWCYRYTPKGAYAVVPPAEMSRFQRTIGHFTPDFDIQPLGTSKIGIGEMVRVIGGPMAGYEGVVYAIEDGSNTRLFRLQVLAENGIEWKMDIDERQIERLDDSLDHSDTDDFASFSDSLDASASSEGLDTLDLEEFPLTLEF
ncbi:MAG: hypothetical protein K2J63_05445 [Muribaculaceae bacterium]|nr:hypothetical protein [Muribaculaceae bacterium]